MLIQLLENGGGNGFNRPSGAPDLAYIIYQIYEWMASHTIYFPFNGKYYAFTFWQCFITIVGFWLVVDVICMGWRLLNRNEVVFMGYWED